MSRHNIYMRYSIIMSVCSNINMKIRNNPVAIRSGHMEIILNIWVEMTNGLFFYSCVWGSVWILHVHIFTHLCSDLNFLWSSGRRCIWKICHLAADSLCKEVSILINTLSRSAGAFCSRGVIDGVCGGEKRFEKVGLVNYKQHYKRSTS